MVIIEHEDNYYDIGDKLILKKEVFTKKAKNNHRCFRLMEMDRESLSMRCSDVKIINIYHLLV